MNIKKMIGLNDEALLLDSRLYIIKAVFAVATGYLVGKSIPIANIDMISVLLGVMYNLEPINMLGIKSGISQLLASTLGAFATGVTIFFFGINVYTIGISIAFTLYIALKINWRMVSPVAIFTAIYMTQFVQSNSLGEPSVWLTFRVRIVALVTGVIIAIVFNFIFSFFYYKRILVKRVNFAKIRISKAFDTTIDNLNGNGEKRGYIGIFPQIFNDLDMVYFNLLAMEKESSLFNVSDENMENNKKAQQKLRDIAHLLYDINFSIEEFDSSKKESISQILIKLKELFFNCDKEVTIYTGNDRVDQNLNKIYNSIKDLYLLY
jgi:hypothetical protein